MHPHTVFYSKASEGALYADSTSGAGKSDDYVAPGKTQTYIWVVSQEGTPAAGDPNCLTWLYHSHIKPTMDMNTGPVGKICFYYMLLICFYSFVRTVLIGGGGV